MVARLGDGRVVAFAPSCPHQATDLDDATIWDGNLRCPRHSYLYDLQSGQNIFPTRDTRPEDLWKLRPRYLPCFEVAEREGWIWVATEAQGPPASYDPTLEERPSSPAAASASASVTTPPVTTTAVLQQSMKFLTVTAGSTFEIRLPTTPRPGFAWSFDVTGPLLRVVDEQFEPGDMPCHCIWVAAEGTGAATLTCTYTGPPGEPKGEVRIYVVRAQPA